MGELRRGVRVLESMEIIKVFFYVAFYLPLHFLEISFHFIPEPISLK